MNYVKIAYIGVVDPDINKILKLLLVLTSLALYY
jgi:hypothetical protein